MRLAPRRAIRSVPSLFLAFLLTWLVTGEGLASTGTVPVLIKTSVPLTPDVLAAFKQKTISITYVWPEIRAMAAVVSPRKLSTLQADPLVQLVEADLQAGDMGDPPTSNPTTPESVTAPFSTGSIVTWNQDMANTPGPAQTGRGVTVAVVDAGLPQNWEDFLPANCMDLEHAAGFGAEGWGDFHNPQNGIPGVGGHIGLFPHGVAVSSVIVGFPSEFGSIGGAAPDVRLIPIRILNQFNTAWFSWMTAGIMYAGNLKASGAVPGPMVINFSIQAHGDSQVLKDAIDYAIAQGAIFVTIAGNFNPEAPVSFPGRLPESITAGAVGWTQEWSAPYPWFFSDVPEHDASQVYVAPFSGREPLSAPPGSMIDVLCPGSYVFGEWLFGHGFSEGRQVAVDAVDNFIFGTSFAAPHVVGIVARMLEKNPLLTQSDVEAILKGTALPIPPSLGFGPYPAWDERATGAGLAQGEEAVAATPLPPLVSPAGRQFGGAGTAATPSVHVVAQGMPMEFRIAGFGDRAHTLRVFDVQGRLVRHWPSSTSVRETWDGARDDGTTAPSGVYFVVARGEGIQRSAKLVLAR